VSYTFVAENRFSGGRMQPLTTIILSAVVGSVCGVIANVLTLKHQLQAQNEYTILMKIWDKAYWLKSRANSLRPKHDTGSPNAAEEKQRRLAAFDTAKAEFDEEVYLNKPFYPKDIYCCLLELGNSAVYEAIDYYHQNASPDNHKYWADSDASAEKINRLTDQLCEAIRDRIHVAYRFRKRTHAVAKWIDWLLSLIKRLFARREPVHQR
jgi:hypothetical protein